MRFATFMWLVPLALAACRRPNVGDASPTPDPVAQIGKDALTVADLEAALSRRPIAARRRFVSEAGKKELLDDLIDRRLMLAEAERLRLADEPSLKLEIERLLIDRLVQTAVDDKTSGDDISMDDAAGFYREHEAQFARPEAVHVRQVLVRDAKTAARVVIAARQQRSKAGAFEQLVERYSVDSATKSKGGDLGFLEKDGSPYSPTVVAAAFNLKKPGDVSSPVETNQGFHVLTLVERRPPGIRPFSDAEPSIRTQIHRERRKQRFQTWIAELRAVYDVKVFPNKLKDVKPPAKPGALGVAAP